MNAKTKIILASSVVAIAVIIILFMNKRALEKKVYIDKTNAYEVIVAKPLFEFISDELQLTGTVVPNSEINLISETNGKVLIMAVNVGDYVKSGQVIAKVDDELKRAAFITAKVNFEKAKKDYERIKNLFNEKNATENDLEMANLNVSAAEAQFIVAQRQLNDATIKSPINGVISAKFVNVGSTLAPGMPIVNILDNSILKIVVKVPENYISNISKNQNVIIRSDLFPKGEIVGKIFSVAPRADISHNFDVEVSFKENKSLPLKAGMFANVFIKNEKQTKSLLIPRKAIVGSLKEASVFVVEGGNAIKRNIIVGREHKDMIEVLSGLNGNEMIVIAGQNNLSNNASVKITNNN
ncbi:MAG TPA: efflux RND transporter periplasmic adaptor subunit [Ignavibacteriales bacterium]|nr:efflux RND transporter periplasmic adaptor subunit [Ignavibacteriales bacterium]